MSKKEERIGDDDLAELREVYAGERQARVALDAHRQQQQQLQANVLAASGALKHVFARIAKKHNLPRVDGIDPETGLIKRGAFAPKKVD